MNLPSTHLNVTPKLWRSLRWAFAVSVAAVGLWGGFRIGKKSDFAVERAEPASQIQRFRVGGTSMVPTLLPAHHLATCRHCDLQYPIDANCDRSQVMCFHCGGGLGDFQKMPGDELGVMPLSPRRAIKQGDIVLIEGHAVHPGDATPVLKRVLATGGQTVEIHDDEIHVRSNDQLSERPMVWLPVDFDASRTQSRWRVVGDVEDSAVLYHHVSVHDHGLPSPIYDDIPFNVSVNRILKRPRQLRVRAIYAGQQEGRVTIVAWVDGQVFMRERRLAPNESFTCSLGCVSDLPHSGIKVDPGWKSLVTANQPVLVLGPTLDRVIEQAMVYRVRACDDKGIYPIELKSNEVFVVGDNVPVSIDSRSFGSVPQSAILGVVTKDR